jgi:hypothetical protein
MARLRLWGPWCAALRCWAWLWELWLGSFGAIGPALLGAPQSLQQES